MCKDGVVTLSGAVENCQAERSRQPKLAKKVKGVKQVVNNIDRQRHETCGQMTRAVRLPLRCRRLWRSSSSRRISRAVKFELPGQGLHVTPKVRPGRKEGYLVFSDTPSDRLLKWVPGHEVEVFRADAHGPSGNAFDAQGRLYTCETRTRRVTRTDKKGKIEVLADKWEGKRLNAPNDIVVSKTDTSTSPTRRSASRATIASWISTASITSRPKGR